MDSIGRGTVRLFVAGAAMVGLWGGATTARAQERQTQQVEDEYSYELQVPLPVRVYDPLTETCTDKEPRVADEGLRFVVLRSSARAAASKFAVLRFAKILPESQKQLIALTSKIGVPDSADPGTQEIDLPRAAADIARDLVARKLASAQKSFVTSSNNGQYFCIEQERLDALIGADAITKAYRIGSSGQLYGLSLVVPFKLRPATNGFNTKLTESITIGGAVAQRWRISETRDYHLELPLLTAGLTTLDLEMGTAPAAMNGNKQILGLTASAGAVLELSNFQIGFMMGFDRAPGEDGKDWIYNDKLWYSFAIGYSFLNSAGK